jgi:hypothetical protein
MQLTEEQIEKLRQSGIRLDAEGRFWHEGGEVTHHGLRAALWRWLDRNPDGRYVLRLDARRFVYLDVDDAPFVVRSLRWQDERALLHLSDGSEEELACKTLRISPSGAVYAQVKGGRFSARFSTSAWGTLGERIVERDGQVVLDAAGGPYALAGDALAEDALAGAPDAATRANPSSQR